MTRAAPLRLLVHGSRGRMGARVAALAREDSRFALAATLDLGDQLTLSDAAALDVVMDFSSDAGARAAARLAAAHRAALLVGTTALSAETRLAVDNLSLAQPVMIAPNTALGVAVLAHLVAEAARLLGPEFDIDLVESHHRSKRDAPSGTALRLAAALRERAGRELPSDCIHAIRAGDTIGEHVLEFAGPGERIRISHSATSRDLFALGALRAAAWLAQQPPGRYTIEQSLGLGAER